MVEDRPSRIAVGIGNPGPDYAGTRHNLGFRVVERVAQNLGLKLGRPFGTTRKVGKSRWALGRGPAGTFLLLQPLTYVNLTGRAVARAAAWSGVPPESIFVVCDDMNLPLGRIRIRSRGSHGGHKGLASVGASLRTWEFPRLRMGIGKPPPGEEVDFVLGRFLPEEEPLVEKMVDEAAGAVSEFLRGGALEELMNRYNAG